MAIIGKSLYIPATFQKAYLRMVIHFAYEIKKYYY